MNLDLVLRRAQKTLTATTVAAVAAAGLMMVGADTVAADADRPAVTAAKEWKRTTATVVPAAKEWKRTTATVVPAAKEWKRSTAGTAVLPA